jgi:hypothetical protein
MTVDFIHSALLIIHDMSTQEDQAALIDRMMTPWPFHSLDRQPQRLAALHLQLQYS